MLFSTKQATPSFKFHHHPPNRKSPHTKNLCEDVNARCHLNYRDYPYRSFSLHELHCKVCSPNSYDFKFFITFSPIFITFIYLFPPSTDSLKNFNDYFLNV